MEALLRKKGLLRGLRREAVEVKREEGTGREESSGIRHSSLSEKDCFSAVLSSSVSRLARFFANLFYCVIIKIG